MGGVEMDGRTDDVAWADAAGVRFNSGLMQPVYDSRWADAAGMMLSYMHGPMQPVYDSTVGCAAVQASFLYTHHIPMVNSGARSTLHAL